MQTPQTPPTEVPPPTATPTSSAVTATPIKADTTPPPSDFQKTPDFETVPSYFSWFRWDAIHDCEVRHLPDFFQSKTPSRNPRVYKYYRDAILKNFRSNPSRKITLTEVRRTLVGDVGSIRRVFDFLDTWGLINYSPPATKKVEDKDKESAAKSNAANQSATPGESAASAGGGGGGDANANARTTNKLCSGCQASCTIACFVCDKYDRVLCARCYVRGNYPVGVNSADFRRVEIREPTKTEWTEKETLLLLEAVMHYKDDWKRVAEHVGGRTDKECVARFIKLPFREQWDEMAEGKSSSWKDEEAESETEPPAKRLHLTPLADASNPIMAQVVVHIVVVDAKLDC